MTVAAAVAYVWSHVVAFVALTVTIGHILVAARKKALVVASLSNLQKFAPMLFSAIAQAGAFESGKTIAITVPPESVTLDVPDVGKVTIGESGAVLTFTKGA